MERESCAGADSGVGSKFDANAKACNDGQMLYSMGIISLRDLSTMIRLERMLSKGASSPDCLTMPVGKHDNY